MAHLLLLGTFAFLGWVSAFYVHSFLHAWSRHARKKALQKSAVGLDGYCAVGVFVESDDGNAAGVVLAYPPYTTNDIARHVLNRDVPRGRIASKLN